VANERNVEAAPVGIVVDVDVDIAFGAGFEVIVFF
jgi:hypothetical protein